MPVVHHMRVEQGFRPFTNPRPLAHLHGLGDSLAFSGCVQAFDANSNPVACNDPSAVVWMDANSNTVASPQAAAGVPNGSTLLYRAQWLAPSGLTKPSDVLASVVAALNRDGLHVISSSSDASFWGTQFAGHSFNVTIQLQVSNGVGFAKPNDVASIVDHEAYVANGAMPQGSSISVTNTPSTWSENPSGYSATDLTTWLENNLLWIGLAIGGIVLVPKVLSRLL